MNIQHPTSNAQHIGEQRQFGIESWVFSTMRIFFVTE
jgi:hypothetical protein